MNGKGYTYINRNIYFKSIFFTDGWVGDFVLFGKKCFFPFFICV